MSLTVCRTALCKLPCLGANGYFSHLGLMEQGLLDTVLSATSFAPAPPASRGLFPPSSPLSPARHSGRAWSFCPGQLDRLTRSHRLNHPDWLSALIALTQQMPSSGMLSADRVVASATVGRDYRGAAPSPDLQLCLSINRVFNKSLGGSPTNRL